jgi:hypothetical protein
VQQLRCTRAVSCPDREFIASMVRYLLNNALERIWKDAVASVSRRVRGGTKNATNLTPDRRSKSQDLKAGPPEHEAKMFPSTRDACVKKY